MCIYVFIILLVKICSLIHATELSKPSAQTTYGRIEGRTHYLESLERQVDVYLSIPFAKPPIGNLRFQYPQPPDKWNGTLEAINPPAPCWQINDTFFGEDFKGSKKWNSLLFPSEDCLYLNVYAPKESDTVMNLNKMAVMVWIYGGGFYSGSSNLDMYDGKYLAVTSNTIVVSMNYRLGALGFFTLNDSQAPANVGLRDQLMSLQWVQDNIAAFGGDPNNVTIFGESAGALSVGLHLLSPLSRDKFNRAIIQSGSPNMPVAPLTMSEALNRSKTFLKVLQCMDENSEDIPDVMEAVACLRGKPPQLITENPFAVDGLIPITYVPVIDGDFIPDHPKKLMERHEFKKCPILLGSDANEGSYFLVYFLSDLLHLNSVSMTHEEYERSFKNVFTYFPHYPVKMSDEELTRAKSIYKHPDSEESFETERRNIYSLDMAVADAHFVCPLQSFARSYASAGQDVYVYNFNQRIVNHEWPEWMGVLHGDEIMFMFSDVLKYPTHYTPEERALSLDMISYWSNFAKTGDPNENSESPPRVTWPIFNVDNQEYLELNYTRLNGDDGAVGRDLRKHECEFWDNLNGQDSDEAS